LVNDTQRADGRKGSEGKRPTPNHAERVASVEFIPRSARRQMLNEE